MSPKLTARKKTIITAVIFALMPLVSCLIYTALQQISLHELYLPNGQYNDEMFYYKQIEAVIKHLWPQGYYGYNESCARLLTFSAWSPQIVLPYALFGKLIAWNYYSFYIVNFLMICTALVVFALLCRPDPVRTAMIFLIIVCFLPIPRYILSGMIECEVISLCIIYTALYLKCRTEASKGSVSDGLPVIMFCICVFLTSIRPYFALLFFFPGKYAMLKNRKALLFSVLLAFASIIIYFLTAHFFTAEYLFPIIDTSWIKEILVSPISGMKTAFIKLFAGLGEVLSCSVLYFRTGNFNNGMWFAFIGISLVVCILAFIKKDYIPWALGIILFSLALIMFYDTEAGSRHLVPFILIEVLLLICDDKTLRIPALLCCCIILLLPVFTHDSFNCSLQTYSQETEQSIRLFSHSIAEEDVPAHPNSYWDNTVAWVYVDSGKVTDWHTLYGLPDSMGINLCMQNYVFENWGMLKSAYIASTPDGAVAALCARDNCQLIVKTNGLALWKLRD